MNSLVQAEYTPHLWPDPALGDDPMAALALGMEQPLALLDGAARVVWSNLALLNLASSGTLTSAPKCGDLLSDWLGHLWPADAFAEQWAAAKAARKPLHVEVSPQRHGPHSPARTWRLTLEPLAPPHGERWWALRGSDVSELVAQRQRHEATVAAMSNGVVIRDAGGRVVSANQAACEMLQVTIRQMNGEVPFEPGWALIDTQHRELPVHALPNFQVQRTGGSVRHATMGVRTTLGEVRWLLINAEPIRDVRGNIAGVVSCYTDMTTLFHQRVVLDHTTKAAGLGVWSWDKASGELVLNDRINTMLGYAPGAGIASFADWQALMHPDDWPLWRAAMKRHLADPSVPWSAQVRIRRADFQWATLQCSALVIEKSASGEPTRLAGINIDVTERVQLESMLRQAAKTDGLTDMLNRAAVFDQVQAAIDRAARQPGFGFAVLFMDFDDFKKVNDTLGHAAGDDLLRQIAERLRSTLRSHDALHAAHPGHCAGRIGGDEFVIVLQGIKGREEAGSVANRVMEVLEAPFVVDGQRVHCSASVGVVTSEEGCCDANTLMRDADTAMYEAKRAGRGRWVLFEPAMHERISARSAAERDLRLALEGEQLLLHYQPVLPLGGEPERRSVEALVRWRHPERGLVPPLEFIPLAEETGLIVPLGQWVLQQACTDFMRWQQEWPDCAPRSVAVNVSAAQLRSPELMAHVELCLARCGMPPSCLQIEVTESLAAQDEEAQAKLRALKALGVRIALDDFGTGYSSLACLHLLPVDTVKIDRSFVAHALTSPYHKVLIEATIRVAQTLGMDTVAEGIETHDQAALLRELACERAQGYLFSKPLLASDLAEWARVGWRQTES